MVINRYNLKIDSLFYVPTNFYTFFKSQDPEGLLQFGHSKENRSGNKLVSYSLLCARESGIPIIHETYPGNIQDDKKFKNVPFDIVKRLTSLGYTPDDVTLVFDKGNHSKEAFEAIDQAGFGFIVSARNSTQKDLLHIPLDKFIKSILPQTKKQIYYFKTSRKIYSNDRDVYVVIDPKKQKKQAILFEENLKDKILIINEFLKTSLNIKKWRDKDAVNKKLKLLIGKKPYRDVIKINLLGNYVNLIYEIIVDEKAKKQHIETLGKVILFTNRTDWSPESIIWGYREQYIVEHAFRNMKCPTSIAVRPTYHHSDRSIKAHVFICVLSLLLLSLIRLKLAKKSIYFSYDELLENLRSIRIMKVSSSSKAKPFWKLEKIRKNTSRLVKILKLTNIF